MTFWAGWVDFIGQTLQWLATDAGLGMGFAIVALTLAVRASLLPITWTAAYLALARHRKLTRIKPQLEQLRAAYGSDPKRLFERTLELYERHDLKFFDWRGLLGGAAQAPVVLGVYQCLRSGLAAGRFLWIGTLAKPDVALAIVAGLTSVLLMSFAPGLPEQMRQIMLWLPCIIMIVIALKFSSALALYWVTSNLVGAAQAATVRAAVMHRETTGAR